MVRCQHHQGRPDQCRPVDDHRGRDPGAGVRHARHGPAQRDGRRRRRGGRDGDLDHLCRHARPRQRQHRPCLRDARRRADRRGDRQEEGTTHGGGAQHGAARNDGGRRQARARAHVWEDGRHRVRPVREPRVPARGNVDPRLLRAPIQHHRRCRRRVGRTRAHAVSGHRHADARGADQGRRDGEVCMQRVPRPQDQLRQRDREHLQGADDRQSRGDEALPARTRS